MGIVKWHDPGQANTSFLIILRRPSVYVTHDITCTPLPRTQLELWPRKQNNWTEFYWGWMAKLNNIPRSSVEGWEWAVAPFPLLPLLIYILAHREVRSMSASWWLCCLHCALWHSSSSAAAQSHNIRQSTSTYCPLKLCDSLDISVPIFIISAEWLLNTQAVRIRF